MNIETKTHVRYVIRPFHILKYVPLAAFTTSKDFNF